MLFSVFPSNSEQLNNLSFKQTACYIRTDNLESRSIFTLHKICSQPGLLFTVIYTYNELFSQSFKACVCHLPRLNFIRLQCDSWQKFDLLRESYFCEYQRKDPHRILMGLKL
jgi:hypothetical protein